VTRAWQKEWLDHFYNQRPGWVDGTTEFHEMIATYASHGAEILEVGAGPDNPTSRFLASLGKVDGVDPDRDVLSNSSLRRREVISGEPFPFDDASYDVCVSNYVVEHVKDARAHLGEVRRVLRPGGHYLFRTPNRWHYVALVSSLTGHGFHRKVANRLRDLDSDSHEPYPTAYVMNTRRAVVRAARDAGLAVAECRLVEKEPSYGMYSRLLFLPMMAYERAVNATPWLAELRSNLFVALRR
jgi:SAM-dependent methyltransferase